MHLLRLRPSGCAARGCRLGARLSSTTWRACSRVQAVSVNMRGAGASRGSLDGMTVHDLAADVAGVLEAVDCGPAHLVGHAFGNRVARCLAVDRPSLVRSVILLAAGVLIGTATPLGTSFRNATEVKMNGIDCVTRARRALAVAGVGSENTCRGRMLAGGVSPTSRPAGVWRSKVVAVSDSAPCDQGLDDEAAPPGNGHALREQFGERVRSVHRPAACGTLSAAGAARSRYPRRCRVCRRWRSTSLTACARSRGAEIARYDDTFVGRFPEPWNRQRCLPLRDTHLISRGTIIPKRGPSQ